MPEPIHMPHSILFSDIALLWCIMEYKKVVGSHPAVQSAFNAYNNFLEKKGIDLRYATPITSQNTRESTLRRLRNLGLITEKVLDLTEETYELFEVAGRNWRKWPVELPVNIDEDGEIHYDFQNAEYAPNGKRRSPKPKS